MNDKKTVYKKTVLAGVIAGLSLAGAVGVNAESLKLEEVVVTAQKRTESLMDVPISIATMSGGKIDDRGITSLQELTQYMPNVTVNAGSGTPNLFIRGIGSGTNQGFEQSVGMYIDGVYAGRGPLAAVPTTMDLERVEVLKGPQGILFGKNTIAGAINTTTAKPTDEFEGMVETMYELERGAQQYDLMLSGPLTDGLSGRLAVRHNEPGDGWWENVATGDKGPGFDTWYARGSLRWEASDNLEINAKYEYGDFQSENTPSVVYQSDFAGQQNFDGAVPIPVISDRDKGAGDVGTRKSTGTDVFALTVDWNLDFATLTSISAYSAYELESTGNTDLVATPSLHRTRWEDYEQYSQELRLVSPGGEAIDWIAGAYYQQSELDISRRLETVDFLQSGPLSTSALYQPDAGVPSVFDQEGESWAVFAQGTWNATDALRLTLGLRYNQESKRLDKSTDSEGLQVRAGSNPDLLVYSNPANFYSIADLRQHNFTGLSREEEKVTFSSNVQWDVSDNTMLYASVSTGFKGGGFDEAYSGAGYEIRLVNPITNAPVGDPIAGNDSSILEVEDEEVLAYELGAKMSLLDGTAELNLAMFRMEYENLQTSSLVGDVFRVGNAGEAVSQGVELGGRIMLSERLTVGGAMAYLDAYYEDFEGATCTTPQAMDPANNPGCLLEDGSNIVSAGQQGGQNLSDETLVFAPEWSASFFAQYVVPVGSSMELINGLDINYSDEYFSSLDLDPNTKHDATTIINARIALASTEDSWTLALVGKNLTDEKTYLWKGDLPVTNSNSYYGVPESPRTVSLQGRYRF
ncbi:Vitamin B12 transporter BtuB [Sinobacterium norvegicum]|uniref:Vitamin B12 transporter BtuB n=1 Tax=Sinobacterium norvegicum TaxID=1641715 RepID=A0ABM9ABU6_9GAMM|nr:TonB-dependent receptor [Sinobacterium norvegicum]CAH0990677.1 Vitamin B12 transporter BtuB [Sinobacterium norvegicum]